MRLNALEIRAAAAPAPAANGALTVATWNIGYAALGREASFIADGGSALRALPRSAIAQAAEAIAAQAAAADWDALLIQEAAKPGFMTRGVDVLGALDAAAPGAARFFHADARWPLPRLRHGVALFARVRAEAPALHPLPRPRSIGPTRRYAALSVRLPRADGGAWRVACAHLAAFDPNADLRRRQLRSLLEQVGALAAAEGAVAIVGGDFNLRLAATTWPHATPSRHTAWLHDLRPADAPPPWRLACDPSVATVRTLHRPYREGVNARAVIDGFFVGAGARAQMVRGLDLGFEHSDHQPAILRAEATP